MPALRTERSRQSSIWICSMAGSIAHPSIPAWVRCPSSLDSVPMDTSWPRAASSETIGTAG